MRSIALVSVDGSIDFLCFPNFDSPSVFAAILDPQRGGFLSISPDIEDLHTRQLYLPDTNILLTRFLSEAVVAEITDFMPIVESKDETPYGHHILRMLRVIKGRITFQMRCAPRFDYARTGHAAHNEQGSICFVPESKNCPSMALHATFPMQLDGNDAIATFTLGAGESATLAFGQVDEEEKTGAAVLDPANVDEHFKETSRFWRSWIRRSNYTGRWREMVNRSALMLKLLCSAEHGSLIAAPTFGLPEQVGGERNWDYRYTWLRDSSFSLYAFMRWDSWRKPAPSHAGFATACTKTLSTVRCRSCTTPTGVRSSTKSFSTRFLATKTHIPSASATVPTSSSSLISTANSSMPSTSPPSTVTASPTTAGTTSSASSTGSPKTGIVRTRAIGKAVEVAVNSFTPASCAGSPSTEPSASPASVLSPRLFKSGVK